MNNPNAAAILVLCSHLCTEEGVKPLEPKEWSLLAQKLMTLHKQPSDILNWSEREFCDVLQMDEQQAQRVLRLIGRSASLSFEISRYEQMGIRAVTRADADYPLRLKKKLGNACPPLFYVSGDTELLKRRAVGYVGSRTVQQRDIDFARQMIRKTAGYAVVSGGAKGIDTIAETEALSLGGYAITYLADSMLRKIKNPDTVRAIQQGRLVLLSVVKPDAGFHAGVAMMRNKYIYAQADAVVVVRSDLEKGGTWTGAVENMKNKWSETLVWDRADYSGNQALIERGAVPIDERWNGDVQSLPPKREKLWQVSLFETGK